MDILIPDVWLREHVKTKASNKTLAQKVSLCGPSIEKISGHKKETIYHTEVTTNRVDAMSVRGLAREVSAILPRFGIEAKFIDYPKYKLKITDKINMEIKADPKLVNRVMAVKIGNIKNHKTPDWMKKRLELSGMRSINLAVDITNYVMLECGHPTHVFDWDKVHDQGFYIRLSQKGEKITSLENITYTLKGEDIVIANKNGDIVDLPGIIGTQNSIVTNDTKNILFFIDNNDPNKIRNTSMNLAIRTYAAMLNEKGVDPNLAEIAMGRAIDLFKKIGKASLISDVFDWFPNLKQQKEIKVEKIQIEKILGINLTKKEISDTLKPLGFMPIWQNENLIVKVPTFRNNDIQIPEDIAEEIARIHGFFNIPSKLPVAKITNAKSSGIYDFENKIKKYLTGFGGYEVYSLSLVSQKEVGEQALKLKNPMGSETEYLRTNLYPSLLKAANNNIRDKNNFMLYEIANTYINKKGNLPVENPKLGAIFYNYHFREVKGVLDLLMDKLNIKYSLEFSSCWFMDKNKSTSVSAQNKKLGIFGISIDNFPYFELDINSLYKAFKPNPTFIPIPKYPAQIEDLTISIKGGILLGDVVKNLKNQSKKVSQIELIDQYQDNYTFRIYYQDAKKTLSNKDISVERKKLIFYVNKNSNLSLKE